MTAVTPDMSAWRDSIRPPAAPSMPFMSLGHLFTVTLGKMLDVGKGQRPGDEVLPYIRAVNIQDAGLDLNGVNSMPFSPREARSLDLRANDVLVVEGGTVGASVVLTGDMPGWSFQKTVNRLRSRGQADPRFISYVLKSYRHQGIIDVVCNKSTIPHLTAEKLRALSIPAPHVDEQRRIADFLDHETAQIDVLIGKQRQLIECLCERRAALIEGVIANSADVTIRLGLVARSRSGDVAPGDVTAGPVEIWGAGRLVGYTWTANAHAGDILVGRVGAGSVGKVRRLTVDAWATDNTVVLTLDKRRVEPRFVEHCIRRIPRFELVGGGAMPLLTADRLLSQRIPYPSIAAQQRIADDLEERNAKIDSLVAKAEEFIGLARERRATLITEAVTGRIDVSTGKAREGAA